jgi:ferredoxin
MKIKIDSNLCQGLNRCRAVLPEVISGSDDGKSGVMSDGTVPPGLEDDAQVAVDGCPVKAISIVES